MEGQNTLSSDEITEIKENYEEYANPDEFIRFLRFCSDRLNKDEPVPAIWNACSIM